MQHRSTRRFVVAVVALSLVLLPLVDSVSPAEASTKVNRSASCKSEWISKVSYSGHGRSLRVSIMPKVKAGTSAKTMPGWNAVWDAMWRCVPYPNGLCGWQGDSMYKQLACHLVWGANPNRTGPTFDLETWRPDVTVSRHRLPEYVQLDVVGRPRNACRAAGRGLIHRAVA